MSLCWFKSFIKCPTNYYELNELMFVKSIEQYLALLAIVFKITVIIFSKMVFQL